MPSPEVIEEENAAEIEEELRDEENLMRKPQIGMDTSKPQQPEAVSEEPSMGFTQTFNNWNRNGQQLLQQQTKLAGGSMTLPKQGKSTPTSTAKHTWLDRRISKI